MRHSLASKISISIVGVLSLALLNSIVAIQSAYRFEVIQRNLVEQNLDSVRSAEELEIALLQQRGYVSLYILDQGNATWLSELKRQRTAFQEWLARARSAARSDMEREILDQLESVQRAYAAKRDEVVTLYDRQQEEQAKEVLLRDVGDLYHEAYLLCEEFIDVNQQLVQAAQTDVRRQVERTTVVITTVFTVTVALGCLLLWLFFRGVVLPLRRIASDVRVAAGEGRREADGGHADELRDLGHYVQLLMSDVAEVRSELAQSRTQLAHADKLSAVGKLAAGVAHEIRNPLTAIKMWLYSLRRSVGQDSDMCQKFDFVSDEIGRLESIVRDFLEFSRPQQLTLQPQVITHVIDKTFELLRHRLEHLDIVVVRRDEPNLPPMMADVEQLQQVFLNLVNNSIDAMPGGGEICIECFRAHRGGREMVAARFTDTGTGIPDDVRDQMFVPFFSTKDEGTGLGLCIAASVMARHNGLLELNSSDSTGTQWTVWVPVATERADQGGSG